MVDVFRLGSVGSTQDVAQEYLTHNTKLPFFVVAKEQTAGRGRLGSNWTSKSGHIYLTYVFSLSSINELSTLSLHAGVVVCRWFEEEFGIKPFLKWPNDVLCDGKKICGILCETSTMGDVIGPMLLGIGCNVVYPTSKSIEQLTDSLISALESNKWKKQKITEMGYETFALPPGQPYVSSDTHKQRKIIFSKCINKDGSLQTHNKKNFFSHSKDLMWMHSESYQQPILFADVGNSRTKLFRVNQADKNAIISIGKISEFKSSSVKAIYAVSVNQKNLKDLQTKAKKLKLQFFQIPKRTIKSKLGKYPLEQIGIDRLCLIEGWLADHYFANRSAQRIGVIFSAGTALTADFVLSSGAYLGGWILPGIEMSLTNLAEKTAALPMVSANELVVSEGLNFGLNTKSSILNGQSFTLTAVMERVKLLISSAYPNLEADFICTGGNYKFLLEVAESLKMSASADNHLLVRGAIKMMGW